MIDKMSEPEPESVKRKWRDGETQPRGDGEVKKPRREIDLARLLNALKEPEEGVEDVAFESLGELKKYLTTSERVAKFLAVDEPALPAASFSSPLVTLIQLFKRLSMEAVAPTADGSDGNDGRRRMPLPRQNLLAEVISLLANVCHFSHATMESLSSPGMKLSSLAAELLEVPSERLQSSVKQSLLRLLANLIDSDRLMCNGNNGGVGGCALPVVVTNSRLLDRVVMALVRTGNGDNSQGDAAATVMAQRALRIVAKLAASGRTRILKYLISANVGYYLAESISSYSDSKSLLSSGEKHLQVLYNLTLCGARDLGRQVARSGNERCLCLLLDVIYDSTGEEDGGDDPTTAKSRTRWLATITRMTRDSGELRAAFGRSAIQRLNEATSSTQLSRTHCQFLCYFTQDAWSRVELRESGALGRVLDLFESCHNDCDCDKDEGAELLGLKMKISCYFRPFGHDRATLTYLCQRPHFVATCLAHINAYLEAETYVCPPVSGRDGGNGLSGSGEEVIEEEDEDAVEEPPQLQQCHYQPGATGATSPSYPSSSQFLQQHSHVNWSPAMSPNVASTSQAGAAGSPPVGAESPPLRRPSMSPYVGEVEVWGEDGDEVSRASSSFPTSQQSDGEDGEEDGDVSERALAETAGEGELEADAGYARRRARMERIAYNCLDLLLLLTHHEENYGWLVRPELLHTLIRFIVDAPPSPPSILATSTVSLDRLARSLVRLARCRKNIETLYAMNFHFELAERLVWRECLRESSTAPTAKCRRCTERSELGREVFTEFAKLMDSDFGWSLLMTGLQPIGQREDTGGADVDLLTAHASALMLIRRPERSRRLFHHLMPVEILISALTDLIQRDAKSAPTDWSMPPVVWRILLAFSSLLTREVVNAYMPGRAAEVEENDVGDEMHRCVAEGEDTEPGDLLEFHNTDGRSLMVVAKERICEASDYYKGMFTNDFAESALSQHRFTFDPSVEGCSPTDFTVFLHLLSGCGVHSACCQINTADTCTALLRLADKYLARHLLKSLMLRAAEMLSDETLSAFLPLALRVTSVGEELGRRCCLVLLRHSTRRQIEDSLRRIAEDGRVMVEEFGVVLRDLLTSSVCQISVASVTPSPSANHHNYWRDWCV